MMARTVELSHQKVGVEQEDNERNLYHRARNGMVAAKASRLRHGFMVSPPSRTELANAMILRNYDPADLDAMHALDIACFERPFRFTRRAMQRFAEAKKARVIISERNDQVAGFCILHIEHAEHGRAAYIVTLDVAPEHRRHGIARALMLQAELLAAQAGCTMMALHVFTGNAAATAFYESAGFLPSHRSPGFYGAGLDALVFHKTLVPTTA